MEENFHDISPRLLRQKLVQSLKSKGVLQELKSNLRHHLINELHSKPISSSQNDVSFNDKIAFNLCLEYLEKSGYSYSISVLVPEAGQKKIEGFSREDLVKILRLHELFENQQYRECLMDEDKSLVHNIASLIIAMTSITKADKVCQTGLDYEIFKFDIQMNKIDAKYDDQRKFDIKMLEHQFNEKVLHMRHKIEEEILNDYCRKLEDFKKYTQFEMKKELELMANSALKEKQLQLEETYSIKRSILDERESHLNEMMEKSKETNERNAFLQRQALTAEIEAARAQKEKLHQTELDLQRQRKELREEYTRREAQLQVEEEKLLARKQEFEAIVRQEVEQLRKSDEMEMLKRRKAIEITESQIKIEKETLDTKMQHILALQKEVTEKLALFSEMEITDYQTLKMKLNTTSSEVNTLRGRLKEAFEEIERLRACATIAIAEKSLLSSIRQENEHLRISLENERSEKRQERNQLRQKLEELKAEKDRLEDRIGRQDGELSRLRNRLAGERSHPSEIHVGNSAFDDLYSKNPSVPGIENGSLHSTLATIENARERLRALDRESVRIDEALSRWKEEVFAPSSTVLHMNNPTGDADQQIGCPGNCSAAIYLANSTNMLPLRNLAFSRSMSLERMMNGVIKSSHYGNSESASQLQAKQQHTHTTEDQRKLRTEKVNDKQQQTSLSSSDNVVSQGIVASKAGNLQPNKVSCSKLIEEMNFNPPKVAKCSMPGRDGTIETPNPEDDSQKVSDSTLSLNHLSQNIGQSAEEISPEDIINQGVNSIPLLSNRSNGEEFNSRNNGSEANRSSEYSITELVSDTTHSSNNQSTSGGINNESRECTNGSRNKNEKEENPDLFSKSSSSKCNKSMNFEFEKIVQEQFEEDICSNRVKLLEKGDTSAKSSDSMKSSGSDLSRSGGKSNKSERIFSRIEGIEQEHSDGLH